MSEFPAVCLCETLSRKRLSVVQQLTVFSASLYHRSLQVRLEKLSLETRTEAEARDQVRYH